MRLFLLSCACWFAGSCGGLADGDELVLNGSELFRRSTGLQLQLTDDGQIALEHGVLIEDDGPAAGYSYEPNVELLTGDVRIKKQLLVPHRSTTGALLLVAPGGEISAEFNGRRATLEPAGKAGNYWQAFKLDPQLLATGNNDIVLQGSGKLWIARDEDYATGSTERVNHPNRSAISSDAGATWNFDQLGEEDNLDGEYYVRLWLEQFHSAATLTSAVFDAANLGVRPLAPPVTKVKGLQFALTATTPAGTQLRLEARSGAEFSPTVDGWSDWRPLEATGDNIFRFDRPRGRFVQFRLHFTTDDQLVTPLVSRLLIRSDVALADDWTKRVELVEMRNRPLARSSLSFAYEPYDQVQLRALRKQHKLDEVVRGTKSELELLERLAAWSATRWDGLGHLGEAYPSWNAHEILALHADGKPVGGFCQQFNVVFLQACAAFGIPGRIVSIGPASNAETIRSGHETVEVWSHEFGKWIYFDGNTAWYLVDAETRTPLSLLELRERQLNLLAGRQTPKVEVVVIAKTRHQWKGLNDWPNFAELRLVPRSNFLSQTSPLPLNQGMRGWFWTGHAVWSDDRLPRTPLYSHFVTRREDWEPDIGGVELAFETLSEPGHIRVHCTSQMPGIAEFRAAINSDEPRTSTGVFDWQLNEGLNRLRVYAVNTAGRSGEPSQVSIRCSALK
jgi:transglutaminase-like putative cysteine protease